MEEKAGVDAVEESLPAQIEKLLRENKDGLTLVDLLRKIAEGCVCLTKRRRSMVDQAIFRLKKKDRIARNSENLRFFIKEEEVSRTPESPDASVDVRVKAHDLLRFNSTAITA